MRGDVVIHEGRAVLVDEQGKHISAMTPCRVIEMGAPFGDKFNILDEVRLTPTTPQPGLVFCWVYLEGRNMPLQVNWVG